MNKQTIPFFAFLSFNLSMIILHTCFLPLAPPPATAIKNGFLKVSSVTLIVGVVAEATMGGSLMDVEDPEKFESFKDSRAGARVCIVVVDGVGVVVEVTGADVVGGFGCAFGVEVWV
jgi:hypothetical protein